MACLDENELSKQLKKLCDQSGEEIHPPSSAPILHKLSLLYKTKSPDKVSLVQSAGLLNAAIARDPMNVQYLEDLDKLCSHVLVCANASKLGVKLTDVSSKAKEKITVLREKATSGLKILPNIPDGVEGERALELEEKKVQDVKWLQSDVTDTYRQIMKFISVWCVCIMGASPCKYALVGMGSLAKKEITPFSDFEHIIVLEEIKGRKEVEIHNIMKYFRWYSVIFHIIILNLQESIIPSLSILSLNDCSKPHGDWFYDSFTTRGISFDGMMPHACKFPLGRTQKTKNKNFTTELIKPVSKMVKYLEVVEDLKNGYKLADVLTRTCFVAGDKGLYKDFEDKVKVTLAKNKFTSLPMVCKQLEDDLKNFDITESLENFENSKKCNIKRVIFRSATLFVSAWGRMNSFTKCSSFDIIEDLKRQSLISGETAVHLSYAIAIACQVRLHFYMAKKSQDDNVFEGEGLNENVKVRKLIDAVGFKSLVDYFVIASTLQTSIRMGVLSLAIDPILKNAMGQSYVRFDVMSKLRLFDEIIPAAENYLKDHPQNRNRFEIMHFLGEAYKMTKQFDKSLALYKHLESVKVTGRPFWNAEMNYHKLYNLCKMGRFKETVEGAKVAKSRFLSQQGTKVMESESSRKVFCEILYVEAMSLRGLEKYHEALSNLRDLLKLLRQTKKSATREIRLGHTLKQAALCLNSLGHVEQALGRAFEAFEIFIKEDTQEADRRRCRQIIGLCFAAKKDYQSLKQYYPEYENEG